MKRVHQTGAPRDESVADDAHHVQQNRNSAEAAASRAPTEKDRSRSATQSLTQRTVGGLAWSATSRIGSQAVQFAITAVLARLLVPADFGLVAMYAVFTGFAVVFADLGLAAALIQRREVEERHLSSAFWLNLAGGVAAAALIAALSPAIAAFYGQPQLLLLAIVAASNFIIGAPAIVQSALLQRALNFKRLALVGLTATILSGTVGICAALAGWGVWSLVALTLTSSATRSLLLWFSSDWRPQWMLDRAAIRELWRFSGNMLGFTSINYWARNADNLLIGKFIGVGALGIYSRAYNTMLLPLYQISGITSSVMFSALSGIQGERDRVRRVYLRALTMIALVAFPTMIGLLVVADRFVLAMYGDKWMSAVPLLRVLCIAGLLQSIGMTSGWILQSQGRTDWMFRWGLFATGLVLVAFAIGVHWGALGVSIGYSVVALILVYPGFLMVDRLINLSFSTVVLAVYKPLAASLAMGLVAFVSGQLVPRTWPSLTQLLLLVAVGVAAYGLSLKLLRAPGYRDVVAMWRAR